MARLICLANSWRPGGRCVAGIDRATGEWVRPVAPGGGTIPEERTWLKRDFLLPLDVIEIELDAPTCATRFQCENCRVQNWNWRLVDHVDPTDVLKFCRTPGRVLHTPGKVVEPSYMERLPPRRWTSLELVRPQRIVFEPDPRKQHRWEAKFSMGRLGPEYCIAVTDPEATGRLNAGDKIRGECLLTVSLTEPIKFAQYNKPELCYKLAAAVIEL